MVSDKREREEGGEGCRILSRRIPRHHTIAVAIIVMMTIVTTLGGGGCGVARRNAEAAEVRYVHADFPLSDALLAELIVDLSPSIQARILQLPQHFIALLFAARNELPTDAMRIVDRRHPLPTGYKPDGLVPLDSYHPLLSLSREEMLVRQLVIPDLLAMSASATHDGIDLLISSAYRSYQHQEFIYNNSIKLYGEEETRYSIAPPGHSQHQLGTTIDFGSISDGFAETPAGKWILRNGWRFGFSLSYPEGRTAETGYKYESWHYRYIGRSAARLERYFFDSNQQLLVEYLARNHELLNQVLIPVAHATWYQ